MLKDRPMELGPKRVGVFVLGRCPWERWPTPAEALNKQINGMNSPSRGRPASLLIHPAPAGHAHPWRSAWRLLMGVTFRISFTKSVMDSVLLMSNLTLAMLEHEPLLWGNKIRSISRLRAHYIRTPSPALVLIYFWYIFWVRGWPSLKRLLRDHTHLLCTQCPRVLLTWGPPVTGTWECLSKGFIWPPEQI